MATVSPDSRRAHRTRRNENRHATPPAEPQYLTYEEVAKRLQTTPRFAKRLCDERRIDYVVVGRERRIPQAALDRWIQENTKPARP
jgi:excisionase family DNA binding protein